MDMTIKKKYVENLSIALLRRMTNANTLPNVPSMMMSGQVCTGVYR